MARSDIIPILSRVDGLAEEIETFVPLDTRSIQFRADLAGLLVVAIAATYETCVKEILTNHASNHHVNFGQFAQNHFSKLNSRIDISDLHRYATTFDVRMNNLFKQKLNTRKQKINMLIGKDMTTSYTQLLNWRHEFAHAGTRNTTVEEAIKTHRLAKWVIYIFADTFA
jgi:hypothetical protein